MAGPAQAAGLEASLNGYMEQWFGFSDNEKDSTAAGGDFNAAGFASDTEVHFNATATLDNGLKVQYHVELEGNTDSDQIDESYLRLTANWGQVVFGSENSAMYLMGYGPDQFGTTTFSGDTTSWINAGGQTGALGGGAGRFRTPWGSYNIEVDGGCNDDKRLTYFTPRFSGFQFGVSYTANCGTQDINGVQGETTIQNTISLGLNFQRKFDQVDIALSGGFGFGEKPRNNPGDDPKAYVFGARIGFGGFALGAYYGNQYDALSSATIDNENWGLGVGGSYETGPWGISLTWLHGQREGIVHSIDSSNDTADIVELGVKYALGPGVELRGSIYYADYNSEDNLAKLAFGEQDNDGWAVVGGMKVSF